MAETAEIVFGHREVVEMLIKQSGIHEGIWSLTVRFNLNATNVGQSPAELYPSAVVSIVQFGLRKADTESNIAVDAAKVNPKPQNKPSKAALK